MQISSNSINQPANAARNELDTNDAGTTADTQTAQPAPVTTSTPEQRESEYQQMIQQDRRSSQSRSGPGEDITVTGPLSGAVIAGGDNGDNLVAQLSTAVQVAISLVRKAITLKYSAVPVETSLILTAPVMLSTQVMTAIPSNPKE